LTISQQSSTLATNCEQSIDLVTADSVENFARN